MKLFYYKTQDPSQNFGDELNPWLWPRLLPDFDDDLKTVFIGIGTVLNDATPAWVNAANHAIFFSTGVGYDKGLGLKKRSNWRIYCVRGPLSARKLKLPSELAITDGAALLKRYFSPVAMSDRAYKFSYMPHFRHGNPHRMKAVCQAAGIHYIDPAGAVEDTISEISQSKVLLSEAMHGAIVADTLRVPWIPVRTSPKILIFKWRDWCASVKVPYRYQIIKGVKSLSRSDYLYSMRPFLQGQGSISSLFDGMKMDASKAPPNALSDARLNILSTQLEAATKVTPYLSDDAHLESLVERLEERLYRLNQDICKGLFS